MCTAKWISYPYPYPYIHTLDSFPIQAIIEYWVEFPVLYLSAREVVSVVSDSLRPYGL